MEKKTVVKIKRRPPDCSAVASVYSDDINKANYEDLLPMHSESVAELLEFYASIPDYGEVHHLSDKEFNQRLQTLREKATKLWTSDLSESKFDNKSACSERQGGKSVLCQSTPDLRPPTSTFKARPVPKNLFSSRNNYKMQNAEVYRSLQRKVRAEKLLHSSSLPPSMAAREKGSRSISSNFQSGCGSRLTESECSSAKEGKCNTEVVKQNCTGGHCDKKDSTPIGCPSTSGITSTSSNESFPAVFRMRMQSCPPSVGIPSKNNLAAILRIQSTRQKMERDLEDKLAELKRKEDACIKAHLARQQPAWQAIQYNTEEDLALRRILRKEKEKRHLREHQLQMNLMLARVQQIPPLFERQTARRSIGQCRK
ncbi:Uncharacterized protein GBIM_13578 [Gryllus bimaculatus]|nr:Uncharacterized protein GBIM_13578 [Gryllus bimaculatus]